MYETHDFCIADLYVRVRFKQPEKNNIRLLPSFNPFVVENVSDKDLLFQLTVDDDLPAVKGKNRERIGDFETGNGNTIVDLLPNGGYQYILKNIEGQSCCLLQTNKDFSQCFVALQGNYDMRCFGLNCAMMLVYSFAGSFKQTLLIHASLVRKNGFGYPFIAKSGTGKSTQVSMWLRFIPDCDLMNDDNPVVRIIDGQAYIYGSPWSGKTPCYRNVRAKLGAITRIDRSQENTIEKLRPVEAFASLLPACSTMKWDKENFNQVCNTVTRLVETIGIYTLHCLPNRQAAEVCYAAIAAPNDRKTNEKE